MTVVGILTGKEMAKTINDMVSLRIYISGAFASVWFLIFATWISVKDLPDTFYFYTEKFVSSIVGIFLAVVLAKIFHDITTGASKIISKRTLLGVAVLLATTLFVKFIDYIPDFKIFLLRFITEQTAEDKALSMIGDILTGLVLFILPFIYVHKGIPLIKPQS